MKLHRALMILILVFISFAVQAEMRTYNVDIKYRSEIEGILVDFLEMDLPERGRAGSARLLPNGLLLVEAPPDIHEQIARIIADIAKHPPDPAPRVTLNYWVLSAAPGEADVKSEDLKTLAPVLDRLEEVYGELGFEVLDNLSLTNSAGSGSNLQGNTLTVNQWTASDGSILNADISLKYHTSETLNQLHTEFSIKQGEFVVLGRSNKLFEGVKKWLFYIVTWPVPLQVDVDVIDEIILNGGMQSPPQQRIDRN